MADARTDVSRFVTHRGCVVRPDDGVDDVVATSRVDDGAAGVDESAVFVSTAAVFAVLVIIHISSSNHDDGAGIDIHESRRAARLGVLRRGADQRARGRVAAFI